MWTFPATSYSWTTSGTIPLTVPAFAVVPPMSKLITSSLPSIPPSQADAITPDAGPDSTIVAGFSDTSWEVAMPPLDCIT